MITVVGEALVDLTPGTCDGEPGFVPRPGGSPFNVAVGAARLGAPTAFVGALSHDAFGRRLAERLRDEGVDTTGAPRTDAPTTLAVVHLDDVGRASYDFYLEGTGAFGFDADPVPAPAGTSVVHVSCGAVTLDRDPAGGTLRRALRGVGGALASFDPNIRPGFVADRDAYVRLLEETVAGCDLVKVSDEDLDWCYPDEPPDAVARRWLDLGPTLVVVTGGPVGAVAFGADRVEVPAPLVDVVDTVGAGDSFTAALLVWLHEQGATDRATVGALDRGALSEALSVAVRAAAVTCTRRGADPPRRSELGLEQGS